MKSFARSFTGINFSRGARVLTAAFVFATATSAFCDPADPADTSFTKDSFWHSGEDPFWFMGKERFDQLKVSLAPEYFYLREDAAGQKLTEEKGFRMGLEASYKQPQTNGWLWASRAKIYGGDVDYNGPRNALIGTGLAAVSVHSTTAYYGGLLEGRYGYRFGLPGQYGLDVMAGATVEIWDRHPNAAGGYDQVWLPVTIIAGVDLTPKDTGWIASVGIKIPIYIFERAYLQDSSTVDMNPRPNVTARAEFGYQFTRHFSLTGFTDSYWFRRSEAETVNGTTFTQPEVRSFEAGAKAGWTF